MRPSVSNSFSAARANAAREDRVRSAGLDAGEGYGEEEPWDGCVALKVLEFESVGLGITGPMERREAAKSGSRASRSIAGNEN